MTNNIKDRNQMECNKRARAKYDAKSFKYYSVKFKISEMEAIEKYCKEKGVAKNTLFRKAIMQYIDRPIE